MEFDVPPKFVMIPTAQWLLTAYVQNIMPRLDEMKSSITSTFGSIIKMDSTKMVTKKLAYHAALVEHELSSVRRWSEDDLAVIAKELSLLEQTDSKSNRNRAVMVKVVAEMKERGHNIEM